MLDLTTSIERDRLPLDAVIHGRGAGIGSQVRLVLDFALSEMNSKLGGELGILDRVLMMRPRSGPSFVVSDEGTGVPVIMPSATLAFRYDPKKVLFGLGGEVLKPGDILSDGDLLITRGNYRDQVGISVVYSGNGTQRTYANLIMRMRVNTEIVSSEFVKYWIMSPVCVKYIRQHTKGTSPTVQKINQRALIGMPFPLHVTFTDQKEWVQRLDRLFAAVEILEAEIRQQYEQVRVFKNIVLKSAFEGRIVSSV